MNSSNRTSVLTGNVFSRALIRALRAALRSTRLMAMVLLVCFSALYSGPAFGQGEKLLSDDLIVDESSVFVPAPREILRPLLRARQAIEDQEYQRAVELLGDVLSDDAYEDYLVRLADEEGAAVSLRSRATRLLGQIPAKDRELYELRYGTQAKQMLDAAVASGDFLAMSRIMERFFYTPAGFNAAMLSGHNHLQQGRPVAAAFCFQRIVDTPEARAQYDPEASVLLATCWMLNGATSRANQVLRDLKTRQQTGSITVLGKVVTLFDDREDPAEWLRNLIGDSPLTRNMLVQDWVMFRGNPQRNANSGTGMPLISPRWKLPTLNDPGFEKQIVNAQEQLVLDNASTIPGVQPLAIGDTVIMRTFDRMIGVDFQTGKRKWVYPPFDHETFFKPDLTDESNAGMNADAIKQRMWWDAIFGQVSSDGQRIYVVPQPGFADSLQTRTVLRGGTVIDDPLGERTVNELIAVDLNREGEFRWQVGGETGLDEPQLAGAFFLGPPLPLDRSLFSIVQQDGEIRLVCLEPSTGHLNWTQQLASVERAGPVSSNADRRLAGATPSFSDGLIICPTGVGALVAVDISTRSLVWGYQYNPAQVQKVGRINPKGNSATNTSPHDNAWQDSTVTIAGGSVLFTPVDKQELIALDLLTGRPKWKDDEGPVTSLARGDSLYIGCVTEGVIVLVGTTSVRALSLESGEQIWTTDLETGAPSGRGYSDEQFYYLPTTAQRLLKLKLTNGLIVQDVQTNGILGNLICHKGNVISHGVDHLAVFPQDAPNRQLIANAEARGPLSAAQKSLKAQLLIQDGELHEAAELIGSAFDEQPGPALEELLLNVTVRLLKEDVDAGLQLANRYETELTAAGASQFQAARIDALIDSGQWGAACLELARLHPRIFPAGRAEPELARDDLIEAHPLRSINDSNPDNAAPDNAAPDNAAPDNSGARNLAAVLVKMRLKSWFASRVRFVNTAAADAGANDAEQSNMDEEQLTKTALGTLRNAIEVYRNGFDTGIERFQAARRCGLEFLSPIEKRSLLQMLVDEQQMLAASVVARSLNANLERDGEVSGITDNEQTNSNDANARQAESDQAVIRQFAGIGITQRDIDDARTYAEIVLDLFATQSAEQAIRTGGTDRPDWKRGEVVSTVTPFAGDARDEYEYRFSRNELELASSDGRFDEQFLFRYFTTTGELEILDRFGHAFTRIALRNPSVHTYSYVNSSFTGEVRIADGVLGVRLGTELFLLDWNKVLAKVPAILWSVDLRNENPDLGTTTVDDNNIWGERDRVTSSVPYQMHSLDHVCYINGSRLICVDTLTGREQWRRDQISVQGSVHGDKQTVIVWDSQKRIARHFELDTGREIRQSKLDPQLGTVWCSRGTQLLMSTVEYVAGESPVPEPEPASDGTGTGGEADEPETEAPDRRKVMLLYDLLSEEIVWQRKYSNQAVATRVRNDEVLLINESGELEIITIATGAVKSSADINLPIDLATGSRVKPVHIDVVPLEHDYLIKMHATQSTTTRYTTVDNTEIRYLDYYRPFWSGYTLAVDRETGKPRWAVPARTQYFQYADNLPWSTPVVILLRRLNRRGVPTTERYWSQLVAIDLKTGRLAKNEKTILSVSSDYRIEIDPRAQSLDFYFPTKILTLKWTDSPIAPAPVAHLTGENSVNFPREPVFKPTVDRAADEALRQQLIERIRKQESELEQRRNEMRRIMQQQGGG